MTERRTGSRLDTFCAVTLESPLYGAMRCIARNVSAGGMLIEMSEPLPLGTPVRIWFSGPGDARITAVGEVKHHYFLRYAGNGRGLERALVGMGVRFSGFDVPASPRCTEPGRPLAS